MLRVNTDMGRYIFILRKTLVLGLICFAIFLFSGCNTIGYYGQAISGHFKLMMQRQPIEAMIADSQTPQAVKSKLKQVLAIRAFAAKNLQLPIKGHFTRYVQLDRPYVAWAVFATPELSLKAKTWCYPVVGCTAYRGFFNKMQAQKLADNLAGQEFDVYVSGISAYSTLGWFDDPLLSTLLKRSKTDLAALIFHELAHQILYVADDTDFNEGFATAVEQAGLKLWLKTQNDPKSFAAYKKGQRYYKQFSRLVLDWREKLGLLYNKPLPDDQKRMCKAKIIDGLRNAYGNLKASWAGYSGYDAWFSGDLNNAKLNAVAAYDKLAPAFLALFDQNGRQFEQFYEASKKLAKLPKPERRRQLKKRLDINK
jgi:predicted aminopeptidase